MSIHDGFNIWLGKALFGVATFAAIASAFAVFLAICWVLDKIDEWRRK